MRIVGLSAMVGLCFLCGCIADQQNRFEQNDPVDQPVTIKVSPPQLMDKDEVKEELSAGRREDRQEIENKIQTSSNNTQNQLSGLVTTSISKLAEQVTGLEANLKDLINLNATMNNTAVAEFRAKVEATLTAVTEIKAQLSVVANLSLKFDNQMIALTKLEAKIGDLNAQVGIGNKLEKLEQTITQNAGRDINYMPMETVKLVLGITGGLFALLTIVIGVLGKLARLREVARTMQERENVARWQEVALRAIGRLDPDKARDIVLPR